MVKKQTSSKPSGEGTDGKRKEVTPDPVPTITHLMCKGNISVWFDHESKCISSNDPMMFTLSGSRLTIEPRYSKSMRIVSRGGNRNITIGSSTISMNRGSTFGDYIEHRYGNTTHVSHGAGAMHGDHNVQTNCFSGGKLVSSTSSAPNIQTDSDYVVINGNQVKVPGRSTPKESQKHKTYDYSSNGINLKGITLTGNSGVSINGNHIVSDIMNVNITGNGDVNFTDCKLHTLIINVTGNGECNGHGTEVDTLSGSVTGNGEIHGFLIMKGGSLTVNGNGTINCQKYKGADVMESRCGHGRVTCNYL
jgi:hypothetical protein